MPYTLSPNGKQVLRADGTLVPGGKHSTRAQAVAHLRALYANVPDARKKKGKGRRVKEATPRLGPVKVYVVDQKDGSLRWVLLSSNSFMDDDKEIISQKALEDDIIRKDKSGDYGPLLWWHLDGRWDQKEFAFRPYVVLGDCDFNAMHGRMLIESGTFRDQRVGARIKERAHALQASLGFLHPKAQPGPDGVLTEVWREERSLLPAGQASNPFTALPVVIQGASRMIKEKMDQLSTLLGDPELMECVLGAAQIQEEKALKLGRKYKSKKEKGEKGKKGGRGATKAPSAQVIKPDQVMKEPSTDQHADATVLDSDSDEGRDLDNIVPNVTGKLGLSRKELARLTKAFRRGQITAIPKKKGLKFIMAGKKQGSMAMKDGGGGQGPGSAGDPSAAGGMTMNTKKGGRGFPSKAIRKISAGGKKLKRVVKELKELRTLVEAQAQGHSEKEATVYAQFEKALKEVSERNNGISEALDGVVKAQKEQKSRLNALSGDLPKAIKELQASQSDDTEIPKEEVQRRLKQNGALVPDENPEIKSFQSFLDWGHGGNGNGKGVKTKDE